MRMALTCLVWQSLVTLLILQRGFCDIGKFWQISDIHLDPLYSINGDPKKLCHEDINSTSASSNSSKLGVYGNYKCDTPLTLVESAVKQMKKINPTPDFILWTGDSLPHWKNKDLSLNFLTDILKNMTNLIRKEFPNTRLIPVLGNNDAFPRHQHPASPTDLYKTILERSGWNYLLPFGAEYSFIRGGYYTWLLKTNLRVIVLNTNLYDKWNPLADPKKYPDPQEQFAWMKSTLNQSQILNQRVILVGHIPPGRYLSKKKSTNFYEEYNVQYLKIITEFASVIGMHIYGHLHRDTFQIYRDINDTAIGAGFLAPSITPKFQFFVHGTNNPSFRLLHYDRKLAFLHDYDQYYLNLTSSFGSNNATWNLEYTARETYNLTDLKPSSMEKLFKSFNDSSNENFSHFFKYYTVSAPVDTGKDFNMGRWKAEMICSAGYASNDKFKACIKQFVLDNTTTASANKTTDLPTTIHSATTSSISNVSATKTEWPDATETTTNINKPKHNNPKVIHHFQNTLIKYNHYVVGAFATVIALVVLFIVLLCILNPRHWINPRYLLRGNNGYSQVGAV